MIAAIGLWIGAAILALYAWIGPRQLFKVQAWRYRDPAAVEPSERGYQAARLGYIAGSVILAIAGTVIFFATQPDTYTASRVANSAELAGDDLEDSTDDNPFYDSVVRKALDANSESGTLKMSAKGTDASGDRYEITNRKGKHPVCLRVKRDPQYVSGKWVSEITTSVTPGRC